MSEDRPENKGLGLLDPKMQRRTFLKAAVGGVSSLKKKLNPLEYLVDKTPPLPPELDTVVNNVLKSVAFVKRSMVPESLATRTSDYFKSKYIGAKLSDTRLVPNLTDRELDTHFASTSYGNPIYNSIEKISLREHGRENLVGYSDYEVSLDDLIGDPKLIESISKRQNELFKHPKIRAALQEVDTDPISDLLVNSNYGTIDHDYRRQLSKEAGLQTHLRSTDRSDHSYLAFDEDSVSGNDIIPRVVRDPLTRRVNDPLRVPKRGTVESWSFEPHKVFDKKMSDLKNWLNSQPPEVQEKYSPPKSTEEHRPSEPVEETSPVKSRLEMMAKNKAAKPKPLMGLGGLAGALVGGYVAGSLLGHQRK